jgi:predicted transcriptional regulator
MQLQLVRTLVAMFVDPIVDEIFPGETGAARLQQIGLFTLIFVMQDDDAGVSAKRLADRTGQALSTIYKQLEKLENVGVIEKTKTLNKRGRGQAHYFSVKRNAKTQRLIEAIVKSITKKAKGSRPSSR